MNGPMGLIVATVLLGLGVWLRLPHAAAGLAQRVGWPPLARWLQAAANVVVVIGLGLYAAEISWLGGWLAHSVFLVLAGVTVLSAVGTISVRNPLYSAIWFGLTLAGTGGLFFFQGAQFLGVATLVVYAGAILVTFMFLLMLANPRGQAYYDRVAWEGWLSASAGAVMIGILTITLTASLAGTSDDRPASAITADERASEILADQHVAHLGAKLVGEHLITIEAIGALLFAALVGATAMVAHERSPRDSRKEPGRG